MHIMEDLRGTFCKFQELSLCGAPWSSVIFPEGSVTIASLEYCFHILWSSTWPPLPVLQPGHSANSKLGKFLLVFPFKGSLTLIAWCQVSWKHVFFSVLVVLSGGINPVLITLSWTEAEVHLCFWMFLPMRVGVLGEKWIRHLWTSVMNRVREHYQAWKPVFWFISHLDDLPDSLGPD